MPKLNIGYVGVGLMGGPMVKRLRSLDYRVRAFDIVPGKAAAAGADAAASPADAAKGAELVLLNLPTTEAVEQAVFGEGGVASALRPPQLLIDFSTIKVEKCRAFAQKLRAATGCGWIDAPVSGGPPASAAGALTVMAGGTPEDLARLEPLMRDIAGRCSRVGPVGAGLAAKMINQLVVGVGHAMLAEAVALCEKAGIDAARIPDCLAGGYADSNLMKAYWPRMVQRDFAPRGYVRQLLKDLEMVAKWAGGLDATTPMLAQSLFLYRELAKRGHAELDSSAIRKLYD